MVWPRHHGSCNGHQTAFPSSPSSWSQAASDRQGPVVFQAFVFGRGISPGVVDTTASCYPCKFHWGWRGSLERTFSLSLTGSNHLRCSYELRNLQCSLCHAGFPYICFLPFHIVRHLSECFLKLMSLYSQRFHLCLRPTRYTQGGKDSEK